MGMLALPARDLQWKIFTTQELMVLMVKSLAFSEFLMVYSYLHHIVLQTNRKICQNIADRTYAMC